MPSVSNFLAQWQDALEMVSQNDRRINLIGREYAEENRLLTRSSTATLKKAGILERMEKRIASLRADIDKEERKLAAKRGEHSKMVASNQACVAEGTLIHAELAAAANLVARSRSEIDNTSKQIDRTKLRLDKSRGRLRVAKQRQEDAESKVLDARKRCT